jgi:hypothetical protein
MSPGRGGPVFPFTSTFSRLKKNQKINPAPSTLFKALVKLEKKNKFCYQLSSLVLPIQLLGYLILTHTQLSAWLFKPKLPCMHCQPAEFPRRTSSPQSRFRNGWVKIGWDKRQGDSSFNVPFKGFNMPKSSKIIKNHQKSSKIVRNPIMKSTKLMV